MAKPTKSRMTPKQRYKRAAAKPVIKRPVIGLAGNVGKQVKGGRNSKL